ncbi:MAG TPA: VCBS domain-containing protein [Streptosporangiaceae bacterium]
MNSPDVAAALHAGAPDAAGQLYDAHAQALFQYCWLTLRNRQHAQTAVCDALVQAGARVAELSDPGTLRAWLFTLARAECHFHPLPSLGDTDEAIARPEQPDAALRIMAWNSVMSLDLLERQALDLNTRHGMTEPEIGLILSLPLAGATELLASARETLGRALGAQILVGRDSLECPGRTEAIHGWAGTVTPAFRDRLLEHAGSCRVCRPKLPQNVSPGRIFGLLPAPVMDSDTRTSVMTRVSELVQAELAEGEPEPKLGPTSRPLAEVMPQPQAQPQPEPGPAPEPVPGHARPDPVPADPVVPDPAAPNPVVPDPAASPNAADIQAGAAPASPASGPAAPRRTVPEPPAPWRLAAGPSAPRRPAPKPSTAKASGKSSGPSRLAPRPPAGESSGPRRPAHRAAPAAPAPGAARKSAAAAKSTTPARSPAPAKSPAPAGATAPSAAAASPARPAPPVHSNPSTNGQPPPGGRKKRRRPGFRVFAGLGAALAAVAVAAGLAYGSLGSSSARLSGADTRFVPGTEAPAQAGTGRPVPRSDSSPVVPSPRSQAKRSTLASPAAGAGAADSVAGGKQATSAPHGVTRMIVTQGQGAHRAVVVSAPSTASSTPASPHATQTTARLTVSPASLSLAGGSTGQVTLSAAGGSVSWTASTSAAGVSPSPASGQLAAGHSATVTVTVQRQNGSGGRATVQINGAQVPVTWAPTATASEAPSGGSAPSGGPAPAAPPARRHHRQPSGGAPGAASS